MIKAKVVSITYSESVDGIPKLDLETYLEDPVVPELFCGADFWDGRDVVIIIKEEYESLRKKLNEKEGEICKLIVNNDVEQARLREKIKKLEKDLEEKIPLAAEVVLHPDGDIVFRNTRVSELEDEVEKLKEENKDLKARLLARWKVKFDAAGMLVYPESKED